jgi:uncharacterized protein (DUF362 family)/Pyruvate/2-oxoacid:ferredoxin oxidoreductase delta subunit
MFRSAMVIGICGFGVNWRDMIPQVSVTRCNSYDHVEVSRSLAECLGRIGGLDKFVNPGDNVALKVNLLCSAEPSRAVTTHPSLVAAVAKMVRRIGARPLIVDSPGGVARYTESNLRELYEVTGMADAAEKGGAELNLDTSFISVSAPDGKLIKRFDVIKPVLEADCVINLPKFKTHEFTYLTAAVKNLFGVLPGKTKTGYHATLKNIENFSDMLIDLCSFVKPRLTIVDAIVGMEGDGPTSGHPREIGLLLAGPNPLAVDILLAEVVNVDPKAIPHIRSAVNRKLCSGSLDDVEILGETLESIRKLDFVMPKSMKNGGKSLATGILYRLGSPLLKNMFSVKPQIIHDVCTGCGICEENCPESAIMISNAKARIDHKRCIRCYCCHELCPNNSVELRRTTLYGLGRAIN